MIHNSKAHIRAGPAKKAGYLSDSIVSVSPVKTSNYKLMYDTFNIRWANYKTNSVKKSIYTKAILHSMILNCYIIIFFK